MDGFNVINREDSADGYNWPTDREVWDEGWRPPAGTKIISIDDHILEEEGLWEKRLSGADKERAPKNWRDKDGAWHLSVEGVDYDVPGIDPMLAEGHSGMWDLETRIAEMDKEGIDLSFLFHGRAMSLIRMEDKAFFSRCMTAFNEWMAEYVAQKPDRLVGVGILPTIFDPEKTGEYIDWMKGLGIKALEIPSAPRNVPYNASAMEPMWEAIADSGIPVMFHVGAYLEFRGKGALGANLTKNLGPYRPLASLMIFSGILERHPNLKVVFCEGGFGWVPWTLQDADRIYQVYETEMRPKLKELPSYYFKRQCYSAIMSDDVGLKLAKDYDMTDNVLWSCDFPHGESVYGESRSEIKKIFDILGEEKAKDVVWRNAEKLWDI